MSLTVKQKNTVFFGLFGVVAFWLTVVTIANLININIPDVWISYSTNECVQVLNYTENDAIENYTCNNLPSKYNYVWVK